MTQDSTIDLKALRAALRDPSSKGFKGRRFNRYDLLAEISRGGMGVVLRARHKELGSMVALKLLASQDPTPEAAARFRREAKVLAQLKHPHVVGISDLGEDGGIHFLAMELIEGPDLQQVIKGKRSRRQFLEFTKAVDIGLAMAKALAYCHEQGAIHRDIKPQNILIEKKTDRPVLTDFGLVKRDPNKMSSSQSAAVSQAGKLLGTPSFMAPEQFEPDAQFGKVGPKSDVWGLGATLFYVLTGQPPYTSTNVVNLYSAVLNDPVPRLSDVRVGIPRALEEVVAACLTKNSDERIDMAELAQRLEAIKADPKSLVEAGGGGAGLRHAAVVVALFVVLAGIHLAFIDKEAGRRLFALVTGASAEGADDDDLPGETDPEVPSSDAGSPGADGSAAASDGEGDTGEDSAEDLQERARQLARFKRRAEEGEVDYMVAYGSKLIRSRETADREEAVQWFSRAAKAGDAKGLFWLGLANVKGLGCPKDADKAAKYFRKAADEGNVPAMLWMGDLSVSGDAPDPREALAWFNRVINAPGASDEERKRAHAEVRQLVAKNPDLGG